MALIYEWTDLLPHCWSKWAPSKESAWLAFGELALWNAVHAVIYAKLIVAVMLAQIFRQSVEVDLFVSGHLSQCTQLTMAMRPVQIVHMPKLEELLPIVATMHTHSCNYYLYTFFYSFYCMNKIKSKHLKIMCYTCYKVHTIH